MTRNLLKRLFLTPELLFISAHYASLSDAREELLTFSISCNMLDYMKPTLISHTCCITM